MRSDAKIGMVIGAAIIALAGWYFLRDGGSDSRRASEIERSLLWAPPAESAGEPSRADTAAEVPVEPDETHIALHIPPPVSRDEQDSTVAQPPATQPAGLSATAQPEPPAETQPPQPAFRTHIVQPGDNFAKLAKRYYDSQATRYVELLMRTNPDVEPRRMRVGSRIVIPPIEPAGAELAAAEPAKPLRPPQPVLPEMYRVKKGDTFHDIAKRLCGDGRRWPELYRLNKGVVGADPGRLRAGQILQLPTDWPRTRQ